MIMSLDIPLWWFNQGGLINPLVQNKNKLCKSKTRSATIIYVHSIWRLNDCQ